MRGAARGGRPPVGGAVLGHAAQERGRLPPRPRPSMKKSVRAGGRRAGDARQDRGNAARAGKLAPLNMENRLLRGITRACGQ